MKRGDHPRIRELRPARAALKQGRQRSRFKSGRKAADPVAMGTNAANGV